MGKRIAIYPGTFDPVTNGHLSLIERAVGLFDHLIVGVAASAGKDPWFNLKERVDMMKLALSDREYASSTEVIEFDGLLADLAVRSGAVAIIRGLRAVSDFEYEFQMALMNRKLARSVETVFLMPALSWVYLSSTIVKDVAAHGGAVDTLVPDHVAKALKLKADLRSR
ncbi:MAG: pantetheine-phosphate adenylyltransferase [bacterium]